MKNLDTIIDDHSKPELPVLRDFAPADWAAHGGCSSRTSKIASGDDWEVILDGSSVAFTLQEEPDGSAPGVLFARDFGFPAVARAAAQELVRVSLEPGRTCGRDVELLLGNPIGEIPSDSAIKMRERLDRARLGWGVRD